MEEFEFQQSDSKFKLYLAQNQLSRLPGAMFNVSCLSILSLHENQLTEIPPAIRKLTILQELNLSQNCLQHLPVKILNHFNVDSRLETLTLWPNPFLLPDCTYHGLNELDVEVGEPVNHDLMESPVFMSTSTNNDKSNSFEELAPRLITRRLGRSSIQVSRASGRITSSFQSPILDTEKVLDRT
jgi:Leucine-rich repeat (LRR) protein